MKVRTETIYIKLLPREKRAIRKMAEMNSLQMGPYMRTLLEKDMREHNIKHE